MCKTPVNFIMNIMNPVLKMLRVSLYCTCKLGLFSTAKEAYVFDLSFGHVLSLLSPRRVC